MNKDKLKQVMIEILKIIKNHDTKKFGHLTVTEENRIISIINLLFKEE